MPPMFVYTPHKRKNYLTDMKVNDVAKYFGNKSKLASALGLTRAAVTSWGEESIPIHRQMQIQILTNGRFKATLPPNWTPDLSA